LLAGSGAGEMGVAVEFAVANVVRAFVVRFVA